MDEAKIKSLIYEAMNDRFGSGRFILPMHMQFMDGRNIQTGRTTGTQIGTATDQKIGFFGTTPVVQQAAPTDAASIIALLQAYGLSA